MTLTAISPRLAMRTFIPRCRRVPVQVSYQPTQRSKRDVPVLFRRVFVAFGVQVRERDSQLRPGLPRSNDFVDEPALGRGIRVGELLLEFGDALRARRVLVVRGVDF